MSVVAFRERLETLPLVLAGPLLRRTEPGSVTVWVALRRPRVVALTVREVLGRRPGRVIQRGERETVPVGRSLHVVAVTARGERLAWGTLYLYDLSFAEEGGPRQDLFDAGVVHAQEDAARAALLYDGGPPLPSFALAPAFLDDLRIVHGSCRRPHGEGPDLLADLDGMIASTVGDPRTRPHQLFLTGDQIYADDVADGLLASVTEAADGLLDWPERLPGVDALPSELPPGGRASAVRDHARFPGTEATTKSHLLSLGEFCAMYLFAWSDLLWPAGAPGSDATPDDARLAEFRSTLPRVRRALANVPVLTMWDDHEVTDGWFISMGWARDALSSPLGRRVLGNAFAAFALFQAWGNMPGRFAAGPRGTAGRRLLEALGAWEGADGHPAMTQIERRVGIPELDVAGRRLAPARGALEWSYALRGPRHDVVVLDTRTRRAYPGDDLDETPGLVSAEQLDRWFGPRSRGTDRPLVLISPPPLVHVPFARVEKERLGVFEADRELWENRLESLHDLLERVVVGRRRVVVLCGDVHLGFTARVDAWRVQDEEGASRRAVMAQLASSPLHNESEGKRRFHREGYELLRGDVLAAPLEFPGPAHRHRVEFLLADDDAERIARAGEGAGGSGAYPPPGPGRDAALARYLAEVPGAASTRGRWGDGKEIVGCNNLGEVTFLGRSGDAVVHELWWRPDGADRPFPLSRWEVGLRP